MKRYITILLFFLLARIQTHAQGSFNFLPAYRYVSTGNGAMEQSVGDVFVNTQATESGVVTEGFLQPRYEITPVIELNTNSNYEVNLFPNPFNDQLNIDIKETENHDSESGLNVSWALYNGWGVVVKTGSSFSQSKLLSLNLEDITFGHYLIKININTRNSYLYKVIKL